MRVRGTVIAALVAVLAIAGILAARTSLGMCCDNPGPVEYVALTGAEYWVVWDASTGELCGFVRLPSADCGSNC